MCQIITGTETQFTQGLFQYKLKLKSRQISFVHNLHLSCPIISKFCTEHSSVTAMLCANFQNNLATEINVKY